MVKYNVDPSNPDTVPKYVDKLAIPVVLGPRCKKDGASFYRVRMKQVRQRLHKYFPKTTLWGYEGKYPGPTIETLRDRSVVVKWENKLPKKHLLPLDRTLHSVADTPEVRTVVHLHGANVSPESDGYPEAWFSKNFRERGPYFKSKLYKYTNNQQATTLWYHDHAIGITRLNVYSGLAGMYIIRDCLEPRLKLPCGKYEIPLVLQDKSFKPDGSLFYPEQPDPPIPGVYPSVVPAFLGNTLLVNGKIWPYYEVEPRKYRFRLLNASNTRSYTLRLSNVQTFFQIGSDGGLLSSPVELTEVSFMPSERLDLIIDFSGIKGQNIELLNNDTNENTSKVMQFRVVLPLKSEDKSKIPAVLYPVMPLEEHMASETRNLTLEGQTDKYGRPMLVLNNMMWHDPITEDPEYNSIEVWNLLNLTPFPHPIHVHLVQFQVLDRRTFDVNYYRENKEIKYTGDAIEPNENEKGWKDTVRVNAGQVTRIIAHFKGYPGQFVWHCHILEHEDHDMMRPLHVVKKYSE